ncbi:MAG: hypothetical protein KGH65_03810 [Candidatus Micrarchaeota archaeon]|nr:hypothetical protein [Candidatus Micrarchaeota archaeon]
MDQLPVQGAGTPAPAGTPEPSLEERAGNIMAQEFELGADIDQKPEQSRASEAPIKDDVKTDEKVETKADDGPEISSLQDLAKYNELPFEQMLELEVPVKIDGKDSTIPLKDVLKSYQLEGHVNNKSMEVSNKLKEVEAQRVQFQQQTQAEIQRLQNMGAYANQILFEKYQTTDWNALKANDPVGYAAAWTEFQQEQGKLQAYLQQVGQVIQQKQGEASQASQAKLKDEYEAMLSARPEWSDIPTREKDFKAIAESLRSAGFTPEEISTVTDHRVVLMADKAARYDALQAKKPEVTQRIKAAPKLVPAGARTGQAKPNKLADLKARLRDNPRDEDVAAAAFGEWAERAGLTG